MGLETRVVDRPGYRILNLVGEIDVTTGPLLGSQILALLGTGSPPLLVDMTGVVFCDSTGLNIAVAATKSAARHRCPLAFVGLTERVNKVFQISGVGQFVATYPTLEAAARSLACDQ